MTELSFESIISVENILSAWKEFLKGKRNKKDVQEFQLRLMDSILSLHNDLKHKTYCHGGYHAFNISDPKPRNIHKAKVRDRLIHHAIYRILYPFFDSKFIYDSYSCRKWKGTHRALNRFRDFGRKVSQNDRRQSWILKCDVRKFFASIDHDILIKILKIHITDQNVIWLLEKVIVSFHSSQAGKGLPLGNLTSQLLVNIYMDWFDQYVKHRLFAHYYIRYADDFVIMNTDKAVLEYNLEQIRFFLKDTLLLDLHPNKVSIETFSSGIDFLGWVNFPNHRVLRTVTKKRMIKKLTNNPSKETAQSYLGLLSHGNTYKLKKEILVKEKY